jgi:coproporphyrinogen III oxidase-like Fe-S oxidoreductase
MSGAPLATEVRTMTPLEQLEEALFTGLRLNTGVDLQAMGERYDMDVWGRYGSHLQTFVDEGVLVYDGRSLRLPRAGMLIAHEVMAVFVR